MIEQAYQRSLLSLAAYADLVDGMLPLSDYTRNLQELGLSEAQIESISERYELSYHVTDTQSGFSATTFFDTSHLNYVVAFRGTDGELTDWAQNYLIATGLSVVGGSIQVGQTSLIGDFLRDSGLTDPEGGPLQLNNVSFVGHSLGGHLAIAAAYQNPGLVDQFYSFNGAGILNPLVPPVPTLDNIWLSYVRPFISGQQLDAWRGQHYFGTAGAELTASDLLFDRPGARFGIEIEDHGDIDNHAMRHLVQSLGLFRIYSLMDPSLDSIEGLDRMRELARAISNVPSEFVATGLSGLTDLFSVSTLPGSPDPETIHAAIAALDKNFAITHMAEIEMGAIIEAAFEENLAGAAYRYALDNLMPFAVTTNVNDTAASDTAYQLQNFTGSYLTDRAYMLSSLLSMNLADHPAGTLSEPSRFTDARKGIAFNGDRQGYFADWSIIPATPPESFDATRAHYFFGSESADSPEASSADDHLYGLGGNDLLDGESGSDYIEGGDGADQLHGGEGADVLQGGEGDDHLHGGPGTDYVVGGDGADSFYWSTGDGDDILGDYDDGGDRVLVDGVDLGRLAPRQTAAGAPFYIDPAHPDIMFVLDPDTHALTVRITRASGAGSLEIGQYDPGSGSFGIALLDYAQPDVPEQELMVTRLGSGPGEVIDNGWLRHMGQSELANLSILFDAGSVGNYSGGTLFGMLGGAFEGGPVDDHLTGDAESNALHGLGGPDRLQGGQGSDFLAGGGGSDTISGGDGSDILYSNERPGYLDGLDPAGEAGDAFYLTQLTEVEADLNRLDGGDGADFLSGGNYTDELVGGAGNDYVLGGGGNDLLSGGAGNDRLYGDSQLNTRAVEVPGGVALAFEIAWADGIGDSLGYDDELLGGAGDDILWGELGNDVLRGGPGDDWLGGDREPVGDYFDNEFEPHPGTTAELLPSPRRDDRLFGGGGADTLVGHGGDDLLSGGRDEDLLYGGTGDDAYLLAVGDGTDSVLDSEGTHTLVFQGFQPDSLEVVFQGESVRVGKGDDWLAMPRSRWGDTRLAITSAENLIERSRLDAYYLDSQGDLLLHIGGVRGISESERDGILWVDDSHTEQPRLVIGPGAKQLRLEGDYFEGGSARLQVAGDESPGAAMRLSAELAPSLAQAVSQYESSAISVSLPDLDAVQMTGFGGSLRGSRGNDHLTGGPGADELRGSDGDDLLEGGAGDDNLYGGNGADTLVGGAGNDTLHATGGAGDVFVFGSGDGADTVSLTYDSGLGPMGTLRFSANVDFNSLRYEFEPHMGDATIHYGDDRIHLDGGLFTHWRSALGLFTLSSESDPGRIPVIRLPGDTWGSLYGSFGADHIIGGDGVQWIRPGYGDDHIEAGGGNDYIDLSGEYLPANSHNGGIGHKRIRAGQGDDIIQAPLHQGLTFVYRPGDGYDTIDYDWSYDSPGLQYPYAIHIDPFANQVVYLPQGEDVLEFGPGIDLDELTFTRVGDMLEIGLLGGDGEIRLENFFIAWDVPTPGEYDFSPFHGEQFFPGLLTHAYVLAQMPDSPIARLRLASGMEHDMAGLLQERLVEEGLPDGVTVLGSVRDDTLHGDTDRDDVIAARAGNDTIVDEGGSNHIDAGAGDDSITLSGGASTVDAGEGDDVIDIVGTLNRVSAGRGNDEVEVTGQANFIELGAGNDFLLARGDTNQVDTGSGQNFLDIQGQQNTVDLGSGFHFIGLSGGDNTIRPGHAPSLAYLGFSLEGGATTVVELAEGIAPGDVELSVWEMEPGSFLQISIPALNQTLFAVAVDASGTQPVQNRTISQLRFADGSTLGEQEILVASGLLAGDGTEGDDVLIGGSAGDLLAGHGGNDVLEGREGDDTLLGGQGNDRLTGGAGNDLLSGGGGDDIFLSSGIGAGYDRVIGGDGMDELRGGPADDLFGLHSLAPADGLERIDGAGGYFNVIGGDGEANHLDLSATELVNVVAIVGAGGNDTITGTPAADFISGDAGADVLRGGGGNDQLFGGAGDDLFLSEGIDAGFDLVAGGAGHDILRGGDGVDLFGLRALTPMDSLERIDGGAGGFNVISGDGEANVLDFSATELVNVVAIVGGAGDDRITGSDSNDYIRGDSGDDLLHGGAGNDTLIGAAGNDTYLFGPGGGSDTVQNASADPDDIDSLEILGLTHDALWLTREGNDLVLDLVGTLDRVTLDGWYFSPDARIDLITTADHLLQRAQVEQLVNAMAKFAPPSGAGAVIPADVRQQLEPVLATVWEAA